MEMTLEKLSTAIDTESCIKPKEASVHQKGTQTSSILVPKAIRVKGGGKIQADMQDFVSVGYLNEVYF